MPASYKGVMFKGVFSMSELNSSFMDEIKETIKSRSRDDDDLILTTLNYLTKKGR
jgi:hypothetical protein